jgi:hypothetical protein
MLQDSGRSRVIACHSWEIGNILLLLLSCYYHMDYIWITIGDRAGLYLELDMELVGQSERGSGWFVPLVSIKDRSLHWTPGQVTDLLSWAHTCLWEREGLLLSCHGLRLFSDRLIGGGDRWRSKHHFEAGPQVWGLGVQVWMGTWNPWQEWNGLVSLVPGVRARRVFFEVPSWAHWFANRCFYVTVWLDCTLAP